MCAHFQFTEEDEELRAVVRDALKRCPDRPFSPGQFAPGQWAPVLTAYGGRIVTDVQKWGLPSPRGGLIINARAETAAERPVFAPLSRWPGMRHPAPRAEETWRTALSLPLYPALTDDEAERVIAAVKTATGNSPSAFL